MATYDRELRRGAFVNVLGLAARLVHPVFFVAITWMFGPAVVGVYLLATIIEDIAASIAVGAWGDAATVFGSRYADDPGHARELHRVLGNAFALAIAASAVVAVAALLGAPALVDALYPGRPALTTALMLVGAAAPLAAVARISIASTRAFMRMEYDAILMGGAQPVCLLAFSAIAWATGGGLIALMVAHVATQAVLAVLATAALGRHVSLSRVAAATARPRLHGGMIRFVAPQSLNFAFGRYITRIDLIMLAAFSFTEVQLAFYGTGALLADSLRQIKLVFSAALGPLIARHHAAGDRDALEATLARVSRWTTTLIVPALFVVAVLRDDILAFIDPAYTGDTRFVLYLLVPPLLSCAVGLAGNYIVFTGHTRWTLLNSAVVAALNTGLNLVLIPRHGLLGAAVATAIASAVVSTLQLVELRALERVRLRWREVYPPYLGLAAGGLACAALWDPAQLGGPGSRAALAAVFVASYGAVALAMRRRA